MRISDVGQHTLARIAHADGARLERMVRGGDTQSLEGAGLTSVDVQALLQLGYDAIAAGQLQREKPGPGTGSAAAQQAVSDAAGQKRLGFLPGGLSPIFAVKGGAPTNGVAENLRRFNAVRGSWDQRLSSADAAAFAARFQRLDAARDQQKQQAPSSGDPRTAMLQALDEARLRASYASSKTLSGDWKEGKDVGRKFIAAAYALIDASVAAGEPITTDRIRALNKALRPPSTGGEKVPPGAFRKEGVSKETEFLKLCIPPRHLDEAMADFVGWLGASAGMHPVEKAARAYYSLVTMHPFGDGNGRTARAVMDWILQEAGFPPVSLGDAKVIGYDPATGQVQPGRVHKAIEELTRALEAQLSATAHVLQLPAPAQGTASGLTTTAPLQEGGVAYANRRYQWTDVPPALQGARITQGNGGAPHAVAFTAATAGSVYFAGAPDQPGFSSAGWNATGLALRYNDKTATQMMIYQRSVQAGETVDVPQGTWSGGLLLQPT